MASPSIRSRSLAVLFAFSLLLSSSIIGRSTTDIIYVYDELGRLIAVIDPAGDTATYTYDAAGNILSISRYNSAIVSIIEFTPNSGPVGSSVTIYGTGFSTTPSQNSVSFNGVAASVTSATFSQIVATVPATATTGPIGITTPAGSATSATSFVVNTTAAPTVTSFTPTIGVPGTAVTITGTNFETVASRNRTKFNTTIAASGTATATTIDTTVPHATSSGRLSVATIGGTGTSTADFFIPPSPYVVADVLVTDRMTLGQSRTVAMSTSNKIGLVLFDATEGQRASVKVNTSTIASGTISILSPKGVVLSSATFNTTTGFLDTPLLTAGTHTILVDPTGTNTGNVNFTLNDATDLLGTLTIGDPTTVFTITTPGQNARITFNGTAGQRISLGLHPATIGTLFTNSYSLSLTSKSGMIVLAPTDFGTNENATGTLILPTTGAYTILVDPKTSYIGSISLTLSQELSGTMTIGGSSQTLTFRAGQNARLIFSGTAGQRVSLGMSNVTLSSPSCCNTGNASILNPDQTTLIGPTSFNTSGEGTVTGALPVTGTYTIVIDPILSKQGDVTLTLSEEISGTIVINGATVPLTFAAGQNALLTFTGVAGQRVSVGISDVTIGTGHCCDVGNVTVLKPDGSTMLAPLGFLTGGQGSPSFVLPVSGTYSLIVNPLLARTGSLTVTLSEDIQEPITINGSNVPLSLSRAGQNALLTFSGTAGQRINLGMSDITIGVGHCCVIADVSVYKPDGTTLLAPFAFLIGGDGTDTVTLPTTGTYSIIVNPFVARTGNITITLSEELADSITINGAAMPLTFRPGQNGVLTFAGTVGQRVSVGTTSVTLGVGFCCAVGSTGINNPDGSVLLNPDTFLIGGDGTATVTLPANGTYSIVIDPEKAFSGDATITLSEDLSGTITTTGSALALTFRAGQNGLFTFSGTAGQRVSLAVNGVTVGTGSCCSVADVAILKPDGSMILSTLTFTVSGRSSASVVLPVTGTYSIPVNPMKGFSGDLTLTLSEDVVNTITVNGGTVPLSISRVGQNALLTFSGTSGTLVTVRITGNTLSSTSVNLLKPDGTSLALKTNSGAAFNLDQKTLPVTGTYSIVIDPQTFATGNITIEVTNP